VPAFFEIFLSSPGDVPQERDDAEAVIHEINESGEFAHHFHLKLYRWDDKKTVIPMAVTDIPQKSVDVYMTRPSACDLVLCIFWSRMGSPLVMDEREYLSGTHYEYSEALEGYKLASKPTVWLYRCSEELLLSAKDAKRDEKLQQFDRVEQFFKQFQDAEGRYTGGVNAYDTHADFKALFKSQLLTYLRRLIENPRPTTPPPLPPVSYAGEPYRGLDALREKDAPIFFGRERETLDVLNLVQRERFAIITGASGSGKSSLAGAGVCAALRGQGWQIVRCVPGKRPFFNLLLALHTQLLKTSADDLSNEVEEDEVKLRANPDHLLTLLSRYEADKLLIFVDQLEELFTLSPADEARDFAALLNAMPLKVLATMRADFYEQAIRYFEQVLRKAYSLGRPSVYGLLQMVTRPAELAGIAWEDGLAQRVLEDAGDEPGALALVAYVLQALYLKNPKQFRHADYEAFGGVHGAIGTRAEAVFQGIPGDDEAKQTLLARVFRDLVEVDERGVATRQRCPIGRFGEAELALVRAFTDARLLVMDRETVEVAHEAVFSHWGRLHDWIDATREDFILLRQVRTTAHDWNKRSRPKSFLWRHERLQMVYDMQKRLGVTFDDVIQSFIVPEADRLFEEFSQHRDAGSARESAYRQMAILDRLKEIGSSAIPTIVKCLTRAAGPSVTQSIIKWIKSCDKVALAKALELAVTSGDELLAASVLKFLKEEAEFIRGLPLSTAFRDKLAQIELERQKRAEEQKRGELERQRQAELERQKRAEVNSRLLQGHTETERKQLIDKLTSEAELETLDQQTKNVLNTLTSHNYRERHRAIDLLTGKTRASVKLALIRALEDENEWVRQKALQAIDACNDASLSYFVVLLLDDGHLDVRATAKTVYNRLTHNH